MLFRSVGRCAVALCVARAAFDALACLLEPAAALRVALDRLAALLREEELDDVRELDDREFRAMVCS